MEATSPGLGHRSSTVSQRAKSFKMNLVSKLGDDREQGSNDDEFDSISALDEHYHQKARIILK